MVPVRQKIVGFLRKSRRGFSIVGVLVAAGMMGGLALFLAQMNREQYVAQKKAETGVEVVALSQRIVRTLYDGTACLNTLSTGTTPPSAPNVVANATIPINAVQNKSGQNIVEKNKNYGNRLIEIQDMKVKVAPVVTGDQAEAEFVVTLKRKSSAYTGQKTVVREFPFTLNLDTSVSPPKLVGCVSGAEMTQGMCTAFGGTWDSTAGKCWNGRPDTESTGTLWRGMGFYSSKRLRFYRFKPTTLALFGA